MILVSPYPPPPSFQRFVADYARREPKHSERVNPDIVNYPPQVRRDIIDTLYQQFAGKCAYCESVLGVSSMGGIDHFRPRALYGPDASLDWHNLLLSCPVCNRNKAARFALE